MAYSVLFHFDNDPGSELEITDAPVPAVGARIELDGVAFLVDEVEISYASRRPGRTEAVVSVSTIIEDS
jgi:hypothetical protein